MEIIAREQLEQIEKDTLASRAAKSADAVRDREEKPSPFRTAFQRDRDRIIHSKSFRRLKHKTQVFIAPAGDHYRTRMTHTLEVMQVGRTIARALGLNEDLAEAIAMGHDLGHTPFGHEGEKVLMKKTSNKHFMHSEQSLRIVKFLEKEGEGLNLTQQVQNGIAEHSGKPTADTLEGQIIHWADKIAYLGHDFEDGVRAGMLTVDMLPEEVSKYIGTEHGHMIDAMVTDMIINSSAENEITFSDGMEKAVKRFREFMFKEVYNSPGLKNEREQADRIINGLFDYFKASPDRMPEEYSMHINYWGTEQTVVDYIAGMTDNYAIEKYQEIFPNEKIDLKRI